MGAVALVQERLTVAPVRDRVSPLTIVVGTLGFSVMLRGLALLIWEEDPLRAPVFVTGRSSVLGARLTHQSWIVWATTAASLAAVVVLFRHTAAGGAMRACAINPTALRLLGIRSGPIATRAFVLSGILAGLVGAVTVPITLVRWNSGLSVGLVAFIAAAIGRFNSPGRTVAAGLGLGIVESMASGLISSQYRSAYVYAVLGRLPPRRGRARPRRRAPAAARPLGDRAARDGDRDRATRARGRFRRDAGAATQRTRPGRAQLVPVVALLAAALVPVLVTSSRGRDAAVFAVLSAIAATGLVLVMGLANQISLGQGAFMLMGGYSVAVLTATHGWNLAVAIVAAVAIAAAGALVVGALTLRLTGFNLAIATLGIHLILLVMVLQWDFTGKTLGVTGVPAFELFGVELRTSFRFYYVALVGLAVCLWLARNLWGSQIGRSLRALGADEQGARGLGVRAFRLKLAVFVVSGAMGGLAGAAVGAVRAVRRALDVGRRPDDRPRHLRHRRRSLVGVRRSRRGGGRERTALRRRDERDRWFQPAGDRDHPVGAAARALRARVPRRAGGGRLVGAAAMVSPRMRRRAHAGTCRAGWSVPPVAAPARRRAPRSTATAASSPARRSSPSAG